LLVDEGLMTSAAPPPQYKRSIRNYLLDAKFQLKWTGRILFIAFAISGLMGIFLYQTSREVTEQSENVIAQGDKYIRESEKVSDVVRMQIKDHYSDSVELAGTFGESADGIDQQAKRDREALRTQAAETKKKQLTMLRSLIAGLTLLVVLIGLLGIYFTHKVVGPIYKMKMLLNQVGEGKLNFQGRLRKGDELQDFFEVFAKMVEKLRARQAQEVAELESAMAAAKANGATDAAIAKIATLLDAMKAALER
jgi:hypothetical protein